MRAQNLIPLALLTATLACEPLVDVRLTLVEPCDQRDQALNGVNTLEVSHDGPGDATVTTLSLTGGGDPLLMRGLAEDVTVTVRAFTGEGASATSGDPRSIGRSMPLDIGGTTPDLDLVVNMGQVDGFAEPTDLEGSCSTLQNGNAEVKGRHGHRASFVPGLNKVLITGGAVWATEGGVTGERLLRTAELYDPATGTFEPITDMPNTRAYHSSTALPDGRVLLVGGLGFIDGDLQALSAGLIYDPTLPEDDPWEVVFFRDARALHQATLLEDAQLVVITGGCNGQGCRPGGVQDPGDGDPTQAPRLTNSIEVFDIVEETVVPIAGQMAETRALHAASALEGGRLLISGGVNASGIVCSVEIFQASGAAVTRVQFDGNLQLSTCLARHAQVTLSRERVMFLGGQTQAPGGVPQGAGTDQVFFWNTLSGVETTTASMLSGRYGHHAFLLDDGSVLAASGVIPAGGASAERLEASGETYTPVQLAGPPLRQSLDRTSAALLPTNQVLVTGGHDANSVTVDTGAIYYGN